jgi:hypothetical protein
MIRAAPRASVLGALFLITLAATAYAECAWVLWQTDTDSGATRIGAFDTRAQCGVRARQMLEEYKVVEMTQGRGVAYVPRGAGWFYTSIGERGGLFDLTLECWPDTVDPREPKAKSTTPTPASGTPGSASTASCA